MVDYFAYNENVAGSSPAEAPFQSNAQSFSVFFYSVVIFRFVSKWIVHRQLRTNEWNKNYDFVVHMVTLWINLGLNWNSEKIFGWLTFDMASWWFHLKDIRQAWISNKEITTTTSNGRCCNLLDPRLNSV